MGLGFGGARIAGHAIEHVDQGVVVFVFQSANVRQVLVNGAIKGEGLPRSHAIPQSVPLVVLLLDMEQPPSIVEASVLHRGLCLGAGRRRIAKVIGAV